MKKFAVWHLQPHRGHETYHEAIENATKIVQKTDEEYGVWQLVYVVRRKKPVVEVDIIPVSSYENRIS